MRVHTLMCFIRVLNNNQLNGTIPAELGNLTNLECRSVSMNKNVDSNVFY